MIATPSGLGFGVLVAGGALMLLGTAVLLHQLGEARQLLRSRLWSQARGRVRKSWIEPVSDSEGTMFLCCVEYDYRVDGKDFTGSRIGFGSWLFPTEFLAQEGLRPYREGFKVVVHYNPADPSEAVLTDATSPRFFTMVGLGLVLIVVGAGMLAIRP